MYKCCTKEELFQMVESGWTPLHSSVDICAIEPDFSTMTSEAIYAWHYNRLNRSVQAHQRGEELPEEPTYLFFLVVFGVTWRLDDNKLEFRKCRIDDKDELRELVREFARISKERFVAEVDEGLPTSLGIIEEYTSPHIKNPG